MDVDSSLARALARRLNAVTAPHVRLVWSPALDALVIVDASGEPGTLVLPSLCAGAPVAFAEKVLEEAQEAMIEWVVKGDWPPADPERPDERQTGRLLPGPWVRLHDGVLHVSFGRSLEFEPISSDELDSIRRAAALAD